MGDEPMRERMDEIARLSSAYWGGTWHGDYHQGQERDGYRDYDRAVPVLATTLPRLAAQEPHGPLMAVRPPARGDAR
ncbi:hypothetical protein [Streptomyces sp. NPDC048442]|uniref:hypothetical protein n=1 Tax=Streptomyces sp. NPDC048442 TaxID=3154823 RepID=UPI0034339940